MYFTAVLLLKATRAGEDAPHLFEEIHVLVSADSEDAARQLAGEIGRQERIAFQTVSGEEVRWDFDQIMALVELGGALEHGVELFSRFLKPSEVASLMTKMDE